MGKTIFAAILIILAVCIFFFYTEPAYSAVGDTQSQIAQYQSALTQAAQLQTLGQKLLSQYNALNPSDVARLQTLLPDHLDNIALILDLNSLASRFGMALENVTVDTPTNTATSGTVGNVGAVGASAYSALTLHFSTFGTYENFEAFMTQLEQSLRIVDLTGLTITPQSVVGSTAATYRYDITIKTYWLP